MPWTDSVLLSGSQMKKVFENVYLINGIIVYKCCYKHCNKKIQNKKTLMADNCWAALVVSVTLGNGG